MPSRPAPTGGPCGASPRVTPFADVRDIGMLLQRAGFALPVTDTDRLVVRYQSPFALMDDLRRGQIELSTSPFYHPILPLVCDTDTHLRAHPHALPESSPRHLGDLGNVNIGSDGRALGDPLVGVRQTVGVLQIVRGRGDTNRRGRRPPTPNTRSR